MSSKIENYQEYYKIYNQIYYYENSDKIKDKIKVYRAKPDVKQKLYEYQKTYRDKNPNIYKNKNCCECGAKVISCNMNRHKQTKKHKEYIDKTDKLTLKFQ